MPDTHKDISITRTRKEDLLNLLSDRLNCPVESLNFIFGKTLDPDLVKYNLIIPDQRQILQRINPSYE